jgi:hypothetical protein
VPQALRASSRLPSTKRADANRRVVFHFDFPLNLNNLCWSRIHNEKPGNTLDLSTMSSPASRRTQRSSATPRRSARSSLAPHNSSPGQQLRSEASRSSGLTPQRANGNIPTSSPLFFRSSPAGSATNSYGIGRSSPLRQDEDGVNGDSTPRASRPTVAGKKI